MANHTTLLFCDIHIGMGVTLNCLHVICGCRVIQTNSAETSLALLEGYVANNQLRLTPSIPGMYSGTLLNQTPLGHNNLSLLSGCPHLKGCLFMP